MILVDSLAARAKTPFGPRAWCHLASDTSLSELHEFAARLGLKRAHGRGNHYRLVAVERVSALQIGARPVSDQFLVNRMVGSRWGLQ